MATTIDYPDGTQLTSTALSDAEISTAFQYITAQMLGILTDPKAVNVALTIGQFNAAVDSTSLLYQGEAISAAGIPTGTLITAVDVPNKVLSFDQKATANGTVAATVTDPKNWYKVRIGWQIEGQPGPPIDQDTVTIMCSTVDRAYGRMRDLTYEVSDDGLTSSAVDVFTRTWKIVWKFYGPDGLDRARAVRSALDKIQFVADYLATFNLYVNPSISEPVRAPVEFQGRWWERLDLEVEFNEQVTETNTVGTVGKVEVISQTKDGIFSDITVTD